MKSLIRDYLIGAGVAILCLIVVNWINAPDHKGCARVKDQVLCYTVSK